jgi:hypothetical protein
LFIKNPECAKNPLSVISSLDSLSFISSPISTHPKS